MPTPYSVGKAIESVETCLLLSPGYNKIAVYEFLIDTIALAPDYKVEGKPIALWIGDKKYIEKIDVQCVPFCKIKCVIRLNNLQRVDLYASSNIYFCGIEYRKLLTGRL